MKNYISSTLLALLLCAPLAGIAQTNLESDPAYLPIDKVLDMKIARPEVNINLPRFLLQNAVSEFDGGENDPFAAAGVNLKDLIKDIKLIRVIVIEGNSENEAHIASAVETLRKQLEDKWVAVVSVPEENVGIYALSDPSGETMAGLALLVHDGNDLIIGNVVGEISIGKVLRAASQMAGSDVGSIQELVQKFTGAASGQTSQTSESKVEVSKEVEVVEGEKSKDSQSE